MGRQLSRTTASRCRRGDGLKEGDETGIDIAEERRFQVALDRSKKGRRYGPPRPDKTTSARLQVFTRRPVETGDALIVASALKTKCKVSLSEGMQDKRMIDGTLTIRDLLLQT